MTDRCVLPGQLLLAFATITLARVTLSLVKRTRQDVIAATRAADAAEQSLSTSLRPVLTDLARGLFVARRVFLGQEVEDDQADIEVGVYDEKELIVEVPLRNTGAGLALLGEPTLHIDLPDLTWRGATLQTVVPAGEHTRVDFRGTFPSSEAAREASHWLDRPDAELSVEISYTDLNGSQPARTRVVLHHKINDEVDDWFVERVELFKALETEPFAALSGQSAKIAA